jgi:hypothetical protein
MTGERVGHPPQVECRLKTPMKSLFIVSVLIAGTVCAGQAPQKKSDRKTPTEHSAFVCPDAEAQQPCKSYQELLKAKDTGLPASDSYICFRKRVDEFFVVHISKPYFQKHWDQDLKQMVADEAAHPGSGYAQTYKDGVLDLNTMPSLFFSGQWQPIPDSESGFFVSDKINRTKQDENDPNVGVSIDETQVNVGYKYKNRFEKTIQYTLTIQRSTGRFAESFLEEAGKFPFSQGVGYCAYR